MPSIEMAIEYLKQLKAKGRGQEKCHIVLVEEEQKKRIENDGPKPATRFCIETNDPELYAELNREKDRIIKRCQNKSIAMSLLLVGWRRLTDPLIDKLMAEEEGPDGA